MAGEKRKRRRWRWTAERRARLLAYLEETGNLTAASEAVGTSYKALHRLRLREPEFTRQCEAAARSAHERLAKSEDAFEADGDDFQAIRRTSNGRCGGRRDRRKRRGPRRRRRSGGRPREIRSGARAAVSQVAP